MISVLVVVVLLVDVVAPGRVLVDVVEVVDVVDVNVDVVVVVVVVVTPSSPAHCENSDVPPGPVAVAVMIHPLSTAPASCLANDAFPFTSVVIVTESICVRPSP